MHNANSSWQLRNYSIAVLASAIALLFSLLISPLLESVTFSMFFTAVVLSSWYGDRGSGALATFLCSLAIAYFFLPPIYSLSVMTLDGTIRLGLFVSISLLTSELNAARKRAESKLQESENRYREMVEAVQDYAIYRLDLQGRIVTWNTGAERIEGYTAKEILGEHFSCFYIASDLERGHPAHSLQIAASQGKFAEEGWRVRKDGSQFWASVLLTAIRDKQGSLLGFSKVLREMTAHKQAEEELRVRARQQKAIAQLGQLALSGINLTALMDETVTLVAQTLNMEYCKILELLPQRDILLLRAGIGWQPELVGRATVSTGTNSQAGYTLLFNQPVVVTDINKETRFRGSSLLFNHGAIGGISVIINGHNPPWGVLGAHTSRQRTFSQNDINFLQGVANILAEAIDRSESTQALQESYNLLQSVLEGTNDAVFVKDRQGRYQLLNTAAARIFGNAKDQIVGKDDTQLLPIDIAAAIRETDRRIMTRGRAEVVEELVREAGSLHTYLSTKDPYRDARGNIIGLIGIARDITERKRAEAALFRSNQRLETLQAIDRAILRAESPEQIAQAALERLTSVITCQHAAVILFNFNTGEAQILAGQIALNFAKSVVPITALTPLETVKQREPTLYIEDIASLSSRTPALERQLQEGSRSFLAVALLVEDNLIGDLTLFANRPAAFSPEDQAIASEIATQLAIAIQQSRLREQLQNYANQLEQRVTERTAALVEANNELEAFGYSVSHDLRAPLRSMQGLAQALQEDYSDLLDSDGQEYIERIIASAERMDGLIQDLLNYSRLSRAEMKLRILNLTEIVTEATSQLETLRSRQAQITIEQPLPEVIGHRTTLIQVLVNLLSNAIKFVPTNKQPQVRVWAEVGRAGGAGEAGGELLTQHSVLPRIRLWVEDNGIGIAPEHQERIFNVFERLHGEESYPGSGIGLAIVRKGVERMGGQVGVESVIGQGSRFWIELRTATMKT
ncbi:PAS domain S-box protein [Dendronalium sp. ChiSLP03b]|uniref:PAS domain S-box protein n=1 Tax=Dendronalium sp. ChiSLP03b TaxID=3075381 RepID=UPI002AD3D589|nr:PAS domain S-box protein [Dendronalium sp. ChiSLP03b]MDZ8208986.1 PAS domain S-box protein [Dendronalium sp. ChiSLP03b]